MSKSFSFDILDNEMMFCEERGSTSSSRRQKMKRMEELSHSLDNGINYIQEDDYYDGGKGGGGGSNRSGNRNVGRNQTMYNDEEEEDDYNEDEDDDFPEDYYYNNKSFDGRPKSFNEKYTYMYDYDVGRGKNEYYRYSLNDPPNKQHSKYSNSQQQQFKKQQPYQQANIRRSYDNMPQYKSSGGSSGGGNGNPKHILFTDEDDVHYMSDMKHKEQQMKASKSKKPEPVKKPDPKKLETKKEKESSSPSIFSSKKKSPKEKEEPPKSERNKESQQVIKARLKLQNVNDDSLAQMRNNQKTPLMHRHHSMESKSPQHGAEHKMSPTILEEIEYETQDEEMDQKSRDPTPPPPPKTAEKPAKESKTKEKTSSKEKKEKDKDKDKDNSAPSTPVTKKSFRHHLTNHKKLFKVPDIDLNNLKLSCLFSTKHLALGHSKNSATPPNPPAIADTSSDTKTSSGKNKSNSNPPSPTASAASTTPSPTGVQKSKSSDNIVSKKQTEVKTVKHVEKIEKLQRIPQQKEKFVNSRNSGNIQSSSENFVDDTSVHSNSCSDVEFEVILCEN